MRGRSIAAAATVGALALGGTAIAVADGGGPFGGDPEVREGKFAGELASKLDGVSKGEVRRALGQIRAEHHAELRRKMASALAAELDVSRSDAEAALEKAEQRGPRDFLGTLARELDKTRGEVRRAFASAARKRFEAHLDREVKEGDLTREQANRIRKRFRDGPPGFHRHGFVRPGGPPGPFGPDGPGFDGPGDDGPDEDGPGDGPMGPHGLDGPGAGFAIPVPPPR
jgi:hypothetical protein